MTNITNIIIIIINITNVISTSLLPVTVTATTTIATHHPRRHTAAWDAYEEDSDTTMKQ
jgi:hypothetical protein